MTSIAVLCGGVGAARLLSGLVQLLPGRDLSAIVNVADDTVLHGLHISPDLDTIVYTLADAVSSERGWGLEGETWNAMNMLSRYGGEDWFSLGDSDLGTHLFRTQRLGEGRTLTEVTGAIATAWGLELSVLPVTDDRIATMVTVGGEAGELPPELSPGDRIGFQEYFVRYRHDLPVDRISFEGADDATLTSQVERAVDQADLIVIAPSNPVVSIDPVLAVGDLGSRLRDRRQSVVAVSPIVGGRALKGPADRLLADLGAESSATGVARWYRDIAGTIVVDEVDRSQVSAIEELGVRALATDTIMSSPEAAAALARFIIDAAP